MVPGAVARTRDRLLSTVDREGRVMRGKGRAPAPTRVPARPTYTVVGVNWPNGTVGVAGVFRGKLEPVDKGGDGRWIHYSAASNVGIAEARAVAAQMDWLAGRVDPDHVSIEVQASKMRAGLFGRRKRRNQALPIV